MKPKNKLAITGFILGIFHLPLLLLFIFIGKNANFFTVFQIFLLLGILTVGFSGIGLYQIKKGEERGKTLAIIGLIISGFFLFMIGVGWQFSTSDCIKACTYEPYPKAWQIGNKYFPTQEQCMNYCLRIQ